MADMVKRLKSLFDRKFDGDDLDLNRLTVSTDGGRGKYFAFFEPNYESQPETEFRELTEEDLRKMSPDELGDLMYRNDPNVNRMVDDFFTLSTISFEASCSDPRGQTLIDDAIKMMEDKRNSMSTFLNRVFVSIVLKGNIFCEVVFDEGRNFSNLICVNPKFAYFERVPHPVDGEVWRVGQYIGGKFTPMESETVYFEAINPLIDDPKGMSLVSTAFPSIISDTLMQQDLRKVVSSHAWPQRFIRINVVEMRKAGFDGAEIQQMTKILLNTINSWGTMGREDTPVAAGGIDVESYSGDMNGNGLNFVEKLDRMHDRKLIRGGKTDPFHMGSNEFTAESSARQQAVLYAERQASYQDSVERMMVHFLTLVLRAKGVTADAVFKLKRLNPAQRRDEAEIFGKIIGGLNVATKAGVPLELAVLMYESLSGFKFPEALKEELEKLAVSDPEVVDEVIEEELDDEEEDTADDNGDDDTTSDDVSSDDNIRGHRHTDN